MRAATVIPWIRSRYERARRTSAGRLAIARALPLLAILLVATSLVVRSMTPTVGATVATNATFNLGLGNSPPGAQTVGSVQETPEGYSLPPRSWGSVRVPVPYPAVPDGEATLTVLTYRTGFVQTNVFVVAADGTTTFLGPGGSDAEFDVTKVARRGPVVLRVDAANHTTGPALFLDRIVARTVPSVDWPSPLVLGFWFVLLAVAAAVLVFRVVRMPVRAGVALLVIAAVGVWLRLEELAEVVATPLFPDAGGYRNIAQNLSHPYDTEIREPLWPLLVRIWFELGGSSDANLRLLTVVLSVALIFVVYRFASAYTRSTTVGLVAAAIMAVHSYFVALSPQGLREELYALLLVLIAHYVLVDAPEITPRRRLAGVTLAVAAACLLRVSTIFFVPFLLAYGLLRKKRPLRHAVAPLAVTLVLLTPHFVYEVSKFGDPLWSVNIAANFYRNWEFVVVERTGCDGCPTETEMARDSAAGEPTTTFEYVFGMHSLGAVIRRTAKGFYELLLKRAQYLVFDVLGHSELYPAYLLGLLVLLLSPRRELLLFPLASINFLAFVIPIGLDPRLVMHSAPFLVVVTAIGLTAAIDAARWALVSRRSGVARRSVGVLPS